MILGHDVGGSDGTVATVFHSDSSTGIISPAAAPILEQPAVLASSLSITDTPIKQESSMLLPFTTLSRCQVDTLNSMGKEMQDYIIGPMPVKDFINKFLPNPGDNDISGFTSASESDVFNLRSIQREQDVYQPFMGHLAPIIL
jgi:hypothetical protein